MPAPPPLKPNPSIHHHHHAPHFPPPFCSAFGASKRWLATNPDGTTRQLTDADFFKAGAITGLAAAFTEGERINVVTCRVRQKQRRGSAGNFGTILAIASHVRPPIHSRITGPIDFFKSQIQVQIIRAKSDPSYKREKRDAFCGHAIQ